MSLRSPLIWWAIGLLFLVPGAMSLHNGDPQGWWYAGLSAPCFAAMSWQSNQSRTRVS